MTINDQKFIWKKLQWVIETEHFKSYCNRTLWTSKNHYDLNYSLCKRKRDTVYMDQFGPILELALPFASEVLTLVGGIPNTMDAR